MGFACGQMGTGFVAVALTSTIGARVYPVGKFGGRRDNLVRSQNDLMSRVPMLKRARCSDGPFLFLCTTSIPDFYHLYEKYEFFGANYSINNCFGLGKNVLNEKSASEAFSE